jgi:hypothetical protein
VDQHRIRELGRRLVDQPVQSLVVGRRAQVEQLPDRLLLRTGVPLPLPLESEDRAVLVVHGSTFAPGSDSFVDGHLTATTAAADRCSPASTGKSPPTGGTPAYRLARPPPSPRTRGWASKHGPCSVVSYGVRCGLLVSDPRPNTAILSPATATRRPREDQTSGSSKAASTASRVPWSALCHRWMYVFIVSSIVACPSRSWTSFGDRPAAISSDA